MAVRKFIIRRFFVIYMLILLGFGVVVYRLIVIQTVERSGWMGLAKKLERNEHAIDAERGKIYDSEGRLIACTIPYFTVYWDTKTQSLRKNKGKLFYSNVDSLALCFSKTFGKGSKVDYKRMFMRAFASGSRNYKLLPSSISYIEMQKLKSFPLFREGIYRTGMTKMQSVNYYNGLKLNERTVRENLYGDLAARTIGNVFDQDVQKKYGFGLELGYDSLLRGEKGIEKINRIGDSWLSLTVKDPVPGDDLVTTLDMNVQDIADHALRDELKKIDAQRGCVILMDVETGEVKACVNLSRVAPGEYAEIYNMAVGDMSEPGSTFKTFSMLVALQDGVCKPTDTVNTGTGFVDYYGVKMTDHNMKDGGYGKITVAQAMAYSSNVGVSKIINEHYSNDYDGFVKKIHNTGICTPMHIEIPGAGVPSIPYKKDMGKRWSLVTLPWLSVGYVSRIPPIYILAFYNAIANNGRMVRPHFVKSIERDGRVLESFGTQTINSSICSSNTLSEMREMLRGVVLRGTGIPANSKLVEIAGKTGTAQLNYGKGERVTHQVSFCGFFPYNHPKYSGIVVIRQPNVGYAGGGSMAGSVFKEIAESIYSMNNAISYKNLKQDTTEQWMPFSRSGNKNALEEAANYLNIDVADTLNSTRWISTITSDKQIDLQKRGFVADLVPNVVDMGAKDAVFKIEQSGMRVQVFGTGRVVSQSVPAGTRVVKGATVVLTLK